MSTSNNIVSFFKGASTTLPTPQQRDADALYFTTDTHRIYLGDHEYSYYLAGDGIDIANNTISVHGFDPGDIQEIVYPLPDPQTLDLDDMEDVSVHDPLDGQSLIYNSATGEWVNGYPSSSQWASFTDM